MAATMSDNMNISKKAVERRGDGAGQGAAGTCNQGPACEGRPSPEGRGSEAIGAVASLEAEREPTPTSEESLEGPEERIKTKDEAKAKRKEQKDIEHILKALNSLQTSEEKLAALCKKYTELLDEHRVLQNKFKQSQRKLAVIMREKDQLQTEHSKAILAKSKLESLCRELQRHNKLVKEESLSRAREEEDKRKEVTTKFQTTINEIQQQMNDHYSKNTKLREENIELANKLKNLIDQYEVREQDIEKVFKRKDIEQQLADAKLAQVNLQVAESKERNLKEKQVLLQDAAEAHHKIQLLEAQEKQLRAQVALYTEKYEEFQQTLQKSNEVFQSFKTEMDKMTKKIKKLEKETGMWKTRWENSNKALLQMAEEKTKSDQDSVILQNKVKKLESLCRALQDERRKAAAATHASESQQTEKSKTNAEESSPKTKEEPSKEILPTKTPPNTPDQSRASPVADKSVSNSIPSANGEQNDSSTPDEDGQTDTAGDTQPAQDKPSNQEPPSSDWTEQQDQQSRDANIDGTSGATSDESQKELDK